MLGDWMLSSHTVVPIHIFYWMMVSVRWGVEVWYYFIPSLSIPWLYWYVLYLGRSFK